MNYELIDRIEQCKTAEEVCAIKEFAALSTQEKIEAMKETMGADSVRIRKGTDPEVMLNAYLEEFDESEWRTFSKHNQLWIYDLICCSTKEDGLVFPFAESSHVITQRKLERIVKEYVSGGVDTIQLKDNDHIILHFTRKYGSKDILYTLILTKLASIYINLSEANNNDVKNVIQCFTGNEVTKLPPLS